MRISPRSYLAIETPRRAETRRRAVSLGSGCSQRVIYDFEIHLILRLDLVSLAASE